MTLFDTSRIQDLAWWDPRAAYALMIGLQPLPVTMPVSAKFDNPELNLTPVIAFTPTVHQRTWLDRVGFDLFTPNQNLDQAINQPSPPNANPHTATNNILNSPAPFTQAQNQTMVAPIIPGAPNQSGELFPPTDVNIAAGLAGLIQGETNFGGAVGATTAGGAVDIANQVGTPLSTLARACLKSQPNVSVRVAVLATQRYVVCNQYTPLENFASLSFFKQFQGWVLSKTDQIQVDFQLTAIPFAISVNNPYIITITFSGWQFLDPMVNQMDLREVRARLRKMGIRTIEDRQAYRSRCAA